ncbi:MAG TPA: hypothetical protein VGY57_02665 [Vicinamibacterales bacterium]|nr:hypothetical protein [Vicinamibacterales bacterium]
MDARTILVLAAFAIVGCQSAPVSPTVIPPPAVPQVPTDVADVWDSRSYLAAWVDNGATRGAATLVGDGASAAIRVDVSAGDTVLRGPDFDPPLTAVTAARVRYRWLGNGSNEVLFVTMFLRPSTFDAYLDVPKLFFIQSDLSQPPQNGSGLWVDELFTAHGLSTPPYSVRFATLEINGSGTYGPAAIHGTVEIDRIALIR